ncbi:mCG1027405 [Mus musculus]|nr:mCG1027405 [Mus musculus]
MVLELSRGRPSGKFHFHFRGRHLTYHSFPYESNLKILLEAW